MLKKIDDDLVLSEDDKLAVYEPLKEYVVILDDKELTTIDEYHNNFNKYTEWVITDTSGNLAKKKEILHHIKQVRVTRLEESWKYIEDDWQELVAKIHESCEKCIKTLDSDDITLLKDFIFAQQFRTLAKLHEFGDTMDILLRGAGFDEVLDDKYDGVCSSFSRSYFLKTIEGVQLNDETTPLRKYYDELLKLQVVFFYGYSGKSFITCDNPVVKIIDASFYKGKMNGLYMPISPQILCGLFRGNSSQYMIKRIPDNQIKKYCSRIGRNAYEYVVSNKELVSFRKNDIKQ